MIALDYIAQVKQLLASRRIEDYYLDIYKISIATAEQVKYTTGQRALYYLLTESLPIGCLIVSENSALQVDESWQYKSLSKIHEFLGQMIIELPETGAIQEIEFIRVIPRA